MRAACFVCAPYAAATPEHVSLNVMRAAIIGRLAVAQGLTPIVPHTMGRLVFGPDEDAGVRELALECMADLAGLVAKNIRGQLWMLLDDAGERTPGMVREARAWADASGRRPVSRSGTWADYGQAVRMTGDRVLIMLWEVMTFGGDHAGQQRAFRDAVALRPGLLLVETVEDRAR